MSKVLRRVLAHILSAQKKFIHIEFYFIFHRDSSLDYSKHLLFLYQKHIYFLYIQKFLRQSRNLGLKKRASYLISESIWQNHRVDSHMERLPLRTCNRLNLRLLTCLFPLLKKKKLQEDNHTAGVQDKAWNKWVLNKWFLNEWTESSHITKMWT